MAEISCDVAIIGAGTAGLAAERNARSHGARTLLIDEAFAGTVCATVGCMPSKLLIAAAHAAAAVRKSARFGIDAGAITIDGARVMKRVRAERDRFVADTKDTIAEIPEQSRIKARARFTDTCRLALDDGRTVVAQSVVIAAGSHPVIPGPFHDLGDRALSNRTVFELETLPGRLAVVGAGPIGLEIAQAMGRLGVRVTLFEVGDRLGGVADDDVHEVLHAALAEDIDIHLGVEVEPEREGERVRLRWSGAGRGEDVFDAVFLATGRPPSLAGLDLDRAGLELGEDGVPAFDRTTMQCGSAPVFIAGDANGDAPILHEAAREGAIAGRNAATFPTVAASRRATPFSLIFTDPPVAEIGEAPGEAAATGCVDFGSQGRARIAAEERGILRLGGDAAGRLTGAALCAPGGEHLAHHIAWAVMRGDTASALLAMPFYHPTLEEGLRTALQNLCRSVSVPMPDDQDAAGAPGG